MFSKKARRKLSGLLVASLVAGLMLPAGYAQANPAENQTSKKVTPVLFTVPAADATGVRPDTKIELQLDTAHDKFQTWSKKYQDEVVLTLINDGGQAVYSSKLDSELQYDPASGKLTFQPPEQLNRYTTYGVVISPDEKIPPALRNDAARKTLPKQPAFKVEEVDPSTITDQKFIAEAEARLKANGQAAPSVVELEKNSSPQQSRTRDYVSTPQLEQLAQKIEQQRQESLQIAQSMVNKPEWLGPNPVRATDGANHPITVQEGDIQKGMIKDINGAKVTLFGGRQFEVSTDTKIHVPGLTGQNTLADLKAGDFVIVTVNAQSQVKNINVTNQEQVVSLVFQTGSALHEPTKVTLEQKEEAPRVTEDGHFTLVSTDDYGLPAWGSETKVELTTHDGTDLHTSAQVLPSASFTTTSKNGRTDVTVVDHFPQVVVAKVSMNGPNYDGYDAHGLVAFFNFRPGLPAKATIVAPETLEVGTAAAITGEVTDIYGNHVEDGSKIGLAASAGDIMNPVWTKDGRYTTVYTAATKTQDVTLYLKSEQGNAQETATIRLLPGAPASMTMEAPAKLQAGSSISLKGQVVDRYNNPVLDGSQLIFSATAGEIPANTTTFGGAYEVTYSAPTKTGLVAVAGASEQGTATADREIRIIPGPVANLTLQAQKNNLNTGDTTELGGQVSDRYDNLIEDQKVDLTATYGQLSNSAPRSNAAGLYISQYTAPFYNGVDVVNAKADEAHASVDLNISSAGTGVNPETGAIEKVATLVFNPVSYTATPNAVIKLTGHAYNANGKPLQDVVFSNTTATQGTIEGISYKTDATGLFNVTYRAPGSQATAVVTVSSADASASATINVTGYGYGYNSKTGQWEKVGSIKLETYQYLPAVANQNYQLNLFPGQRVEFTGHAYSESGAPLSDVRFDRLTATGGSVELSSATNSDGAFTLTYNTPATESSQIVQFGSGEALTTLYATITTYGYGYNPVTAAWEPVAQIVFNPNSYSVPAGGAVNLTGKVTNATGQPLTFAKVNLTTTGGQVTTQVVTSSNGTFSTTYLAPETAGSYTVNGFVNSVSGNATINVTPPPPAYFVNPVFGISGSFNSSGYWSGSVSASARVFNGNGTPMTYGVNTNTLIVLDTGYDQHIDFALPDDGYVSLSGYIYQKYSYIQSDKYGYTYHGYIYVYMGGHDLEHYQPPYTTQTFHVMRYFPCYRCW